MERCPRGEGIAPGREPRCEKEQRLNTFRINGFVLSGGRSTRMGRDKALLEWQGRPLLEHALDKLRGLGVEPRILGSRLDLARFAPVIPDNFRGPESCGFGPLGGIEAALSVSDTELNLFLPIDVPLLPVALLRWMWSRAGLTEAAATIPRLAGRPQPLCAIYHRGLLSGIRSALGNGDAKVMRVIDEAARAAEMPVDCFDVESIVAAQGDSGDWAGAIPAHRWFENLNTPVDLARAALEQMPRIH